MDQFRNTQESTKMRKALEEQIRLQREALELEKKKLAQEQEKIKLEQERLEQKKSDQQASRSKQSQGESKSIPGVQEALKNKRLFHTFDPNADDALSMIKAQGHYPFKARMILAYEAIHGTLDEITVQKIGLSLFIYAEICFKEKVKDESDNEVKLALIREYEAKWHVRLSDYTKYSVLKVERKEVKGAPTLSERLHLAGFYSLEEDKSNEEQLLASFFDDIKEK
jgi:hypothetical protein